jgi:hypothetical protein
MMKWMNRMRARRHVRASFYQAALEDLPDGLESGWRENAAQEYPGIRTDAFFFARAAEGLLCFFDAVRHGERPCALPSDAADSVWHAWLRRDPIGLERFCRKHFGRVIPHVERSGLAPDALANTLVTGRRLEGIAPLGPQLPRLFGLDAWLRMPGGHGYWRRDDEIVYARLGKRGVCVGRAQPHPGLTIPALLAAGLVDADMVLAHMRLQQASAMTGSSCGAFADWSPDLAFAGDGGCADSGGSGDGSGAGGGDGGGACGSSCGGGCGGGGD